MEPLTEDSLFLNHCVVWRMFRVVHDVLHFMKYQYQLQNRASILISFFSFFKSLALMMLSQQMTADNIALSTTDLEDMQHLAANTDRPDLS